MMPNDAANDVADDADTNQGNLAMPANQPTDRHTNLQQIFAFTADILARHRRLSVIIIGTKF